MKQILKRILPEHFIKRYKIALNRIFGHNKFNIRKRNNINIKDVLLRHCTINVYGSGNTITIKPGTSLDRCTIQIFGNNSTIEIGNNNLFKETTFWLEDSGTSIK